MKTKITTMLAALMLVAVLFTNCKKEPGPKGDAGAVGATGPQGLPGPSAKTYTFNAFFDTSIQYYTYNGLFGEYDSDDAVLVYVLNAYYSSTPYCVLLPYVANGTVNIYAEIGDLGTIYINTDKANGTAGSPWTSSVSFKFKAVVIKSTMLKKHPEVNLKNYDEVAQTFNIKE